MKASTMALASMISSEASIAAFQGIRQTTRVTTQRHFSLSSRRQLSSLSPSTAPLSFPLKSTTSRFMSTTSDSSSAPPPPQFDAEVSRVYKVISANHRHPSGPWTTMLEQVHIYTDAISRKDIHVLDLATGPGEPAASIAQQFPESTIIATDVSPDQVALANAESPQNMKAQVADMMNLNDFEDNSFDLVTCCYGYMFPSDIGQAVRESYRVLKPGGCLIATTWNRIKMMEQTRAIMQEVLGAPPPTPPINPLSLADPGKFESFLSDAGFVDLKAYVHEYPFDLTNDLEIQFLSSILPVKATIDEMDASDKAKEAFESVKLNYGSYDENQHLILSGNEYKLIVATKE